MFMIFKITCHNSSKSNSKRHNSHLKENFMLPVVSTILSGIFWINLRKNLPETKKNSNKKDSRLFFISKSKIFLQIMFPKYYKNLQNIENNLDEIIEENHETTIISEKISSITKHFRAEEYKKNQSYNIFHYKQNISYDINKILFQINNNISSIESFSLKLKQEFSDNPLQEEEPINRLAKKVKLFIEKYELINAVRYPIFFIKKWEQTPKFSGKAPFSIELLELLSSFVRIVFPTLKLREVGKANKIIIPTELPFNFLYHTRLLNLKDFWESIFYFIRSFYNYETPDNKAFLVDKNNLKIIDPNNNRDKILAFIGENIINNFLANFSQNVEAQQLFLQIFLDISKLSSNNLFNIPNNIHEISHSILELVKHFSSDKLYEIIVNCKIQEIRLDNLLINLTTPPREIPVQNSWLFSNLISPKTISFVYKNFDEIFSFFTKKKSSSDSIFNKILDAFLIKQNEKFIEMKEFLLKSILKDLKKPAIQFLFFQLICSFYQQDNIFDIQERYKLQDKWEKHGKWIYKRYNEISKIISDWKERKTDKAIEDFFLLYKNIRNIDVNKTKLILKPITQIQKTISNLIPIFKDIIKTSTMMNHFKKASYQFSYQISIEDIRNIILNQNQKTIIPDIIIEKIIIALISFLQYPNGLEGHKNFLNPNKFQIIRDLIRNIKLEEDKVNIKLNININFIVNILDITREILDIEMNKEYELSETPLLKFLNDYKNYSLFYGIEEKIMQLVVLVIAYILQSAVLANPYLIKSEFIKQNFQKAFGILPSRKPYTRLLEMFNNKSASLYMKEEILIGELIGIFLVQKLKKLSINNNSQKNQSHKNNLPYSKIIYSYFSLFRMWRFINVFESMIDSDIIDMNSFKKAIFYKYILNIQDMNSNMNCINNIDYDNMINIVDQNINEIRKYWPSFTESTPEMPFLIEILKKNPQNYEEKERIIVLIFCIKTDLNKLFKNESKKEAEQIFQYFIDKVYPNFWGHSITSSIQSQFYPETRENINFINLIGKESDDASQRIDVLHHQAVPIIMELKKFVAPWKLDITFNFSKFMQFSITVSRIVKCFTPSFSKK